MKTSNTSAAEQAEASNETLQRLNDLKNYKLFTKDGDIGIVHDFLFDDEVWAIRYLVVDTGHWLPGRKVLLTPGVLQEKYPGKGSYTTSLNRDQVRHSPDIDTEKPVSRQHEIELHSHYGWPYYWTAAGAGIGMMAPPFPAPPVSDPTPQPSAAESKNPHLRSFLEIHGYGLEATDGDIGVVDDLIVDEQLWIIRYLVVAMHKWLPGRKVLIAPRWLAGPINWQTNKVKVFMTQDSVRNSPEFDPSVPISREYESKLHEHYRQPAYWS